MSKSPPRKGSEKNTNGTLSNEGNDFDQFSDQDQHVVKKADQSMIGGIPKPTQIGQTMLSNKRPMEEYDTGTNERDKQSMPRNQSSPMKSMIGMGMRSVGNLQQPLGALQQNNQGDPIAGVPVTQISIRQPSPFNLKEPTTNNASAGTVKKFQPASKTARSKSFVKQKGLAAVKNINHDIMQRQLQDSQKKQVLQGSERKENYASQISLYASNKSDINAFPILDPQDSYHTMQEEDSPTPGPPEVVQNIFDNSKDNVKVCVRIRPFNQQEQRGIGKNECVSSDSGVIKVNRGMDIKKFNFDYVGDKYIDQETIFNQIAKPIADSCIQGYNGTIFAYGQTGAGKTYTIQGPAIDIDGEMQNSRSLNRGIMQRSYEYIFQNIDAQKKLVDQKADSSELSYLIKCSFLEIYNEQIMDLLEPSSMSLHVREDIKKGVYVEGLQEEVVNNQREMIQLIQKGSKNRHVGETSMNRESSRSHSVLTTIIESKSLSHTGVWNMKTSRFHIIDLAGSERSKSTHTVGERLKEAGMINKSLSALGNVIYSLVDISEGKNRHVPYRDSKLTFILRDSLGGNSKTVIIANISPSSVNLGETLSTLEFAKRAKEIKNKAVVNEDSSGTILVLKNEIKKLKKELVKSNQNYFSILEEKKVLEYNTAETKLYRDQICNKCKASMVMDKAEDIEFKRMLSGDGENGGNDDSLLIEDLEDENYGSNKLKRSGHSDSDLKNQVKLLTERIKQAEQLLCANLENLTSQQNYYEGEIATCNEQYNEMNIGYEQMNQQVQRDKMKLKLREDKIVKLEQEQSITKDEELQLLNSEIKMLKDQLEQERQESTNPKIQKLMAENKSLSNEISRLEKEFNQSTKGDPSSISYQFQEQSKLIDQLNDYLKNKQSITALENLEQLNKKLQDNNDQLHINEVDLKDKIDELQSQYDVILQQNVRAEEANQKLSREFCKAQVELQTLNEQHRTYDQIRTEFQKLNGQIQEKEEIISIIESNLQMIINETLNIKNEDSEQLVADLNELNKQIKPQYTSTFKKLAEVQKYLDQQIDDKNQLQSKVELMSNSLELKEKVVVQKDQIIEQKNETINQLKTEREKESVSHQSLNTTHTQVINDLTQELESIKKDSKINQDSLNEQICEQTKINENLLIQVNEVNKQKNKVVNEQIQLKTEFEEQSMVMEKNMMVVEQKELMCQQISQQVSQLKKDKEEQVRQIENFNQQLQKEREQNHLIIQNKQQLSNLVNEQEQSHEIQKQELFTQVQDSQKEISMLQQLKDDMMVKAQEEMAKQLKDLSYAHEKQQKELLNQISQGKQEKQLEMEISKQVQEKQMKLEKEKQDAVDKLQSVQKRHEEKNKEMEIKFEKVRQENAITIKMKEELARQVQDQMEQLMQSLKQKEENEEMLRQEKNSTQQQIAEIEMLKQQSSKQETSISYLDESIMQLNEDITLKTDTISDYQKQIDFVNQDKQNMLKHIRALETQKLQAENNSSGYLEELRACKQLIEEKYSVTEGQEQETAETQTLLIEAQDLIDKKMSEIDDMKAELDHKDNKLASMKNEVIEAKLQIQNFQKVLDQSNKDRQEDKINFEEQIAQQQKMLGNKLQEIQKLENEKDSLQFKRDEGTKSLELKIKELKNQLKDISNKNSEDEKNLVEKLCQIDKLTELKLEYQNTTQFMQEQIKHLEAQIQNEKVLKDQLKDFHFQEIKKITEQLQEDQKTIIEFSEAKMNLENKVNDQQMEIQKYVEMEKDHKCSVEYIEEKSKEKQGNLLKEVESMQQYIDNMNVELERLQAAAKEVNTIKQHCYDKIEIIQTKNAKEKKDIESIDEEKQWTKDVISQILSEISDVGKLNLDEKQNENNQKSIEINLLISQMVCEISKLYEKQIVLEKQKSSQDFKKFTEKYEKQKNDIKHMQQYHINKLQDIEKKYKEQKKQLEQKNDLQGQHDQILQDQLDSKETQLEEMNNQVKDLTKKMTDLKKSFDEKLMGKQKEILRLNQEQVTDNADLSTKIEECETILQNEQKQKKELLQELERYKVYLPEAEGLLQEVNERHQGALKQIQELHDENQDTSKLLQQYEQEILDLNTNLKSQRKKYDEQKQLFEVRVQSQEQEIEQHQFRYKELEVKMTKDIGSQEVKFQQVQEQVQILAQSTKQAKNDRDIAMKQMQELQGQVELVQQHDQIQRNEIQLLKSQIHQREQEIGDIVKTLQQLSEANRTLDADKQKLQQELDVLQTGHNNPNQKIQMHLKIKEENNKLREDNFRLQEDLQRKIEIIQKHQKESRSQQLMESALSPKQQQEQKNESRYKKDFETLVRHLNSQQQFQKIAFAQNLNFDMQGSHQLQKSIEIITSVDEILESNYEQVLNHQKKNKTLQQKVALLEDERDRLLQAVYNSPQVSGPVPPKKTTTSHRQNNNSSQQKIGSPTLHQRNLQMNPLPNLPPRQMGYAMNHTNSKSDLRTGFSSSNNSNVKSQSKPSGRYSSRSRDEIGGQYQGGFGTGAGYNVTHQNYISNNSSMKKLQPVHTGSVQEETNYERISSQQNLNIQAGSPVMLNSYSSLYKQNQRQKQNEEIQMKPEKDRKHNISPRDLQRIGQHGLSQTASNVSGDHSPMGMGYVNSFNKQQQYKKMSSTQGNRSRSRGAQ